MTLAQLLALIAQSQFDIPKRQIIDVAGFKELHLVDFGVYTNFNLPNYAAGGRRAEMRGLWLLWQ